jgi:hypothetical protein
MREGIMQVQVLTLGEVFDFARDKQRSCEPKLVQHVLSPLKMRAAQSARRLNA